MFVITRIPAGRLPSDHLLIFRAGSRVVRGTPPLSRPIRHPVEEGDGGRDALGRQLLWSHRLRGEGHSSVGSVIST